MAEKRPFESLVNWAVATVGLGWLLPSLPSLIHRADLQRHVDASTFFSSADCLLGCTVMCSAIYLEETSVEKIRYLGTTIMGVAFLFAMFVTFRYVDMVNDKTGGGGGDWWTVGNGWVSLIIVAFAFLCKISQRSRAELLKKKATS
jgi:hypothetical protein